MQWETKPPTHSSFCFVAHPLAIKDSMDSFNFSTFGQGQGQLFVNGVDGNVQKSGDLGRVSHFLSRDIKTKGGDDRCDKFLVSQAILGGARNNQKIIQVVGHPAGTALLSNTNKGGQRVKNIWSKPEAKAQSFISEHPLTKFQLTP